MKITKGDKECKACALQVGCAGGCASLSVRKAIIDKRFFCGLESDSYNAYIAGAWWGRLAYLRHPRVKEAREMLENLWENGELIPKSEIPHPDQFVNPRRCSITEGQAAFLEKYCTITKRHP